MISDDNRNENVHKIRMLQLI